jgi:hypothetical protein
MWADGMKASANRLLTAKQRLAYDAVIEHIVSSGLEPGDQVESYPAIARRVGVSLALIQRVMKMLVDDRILLAVPRVGTFVNMLPDGEAQRAVGMDPFSTSHQEADVRDGRTVIRFYAAENGQAALRYWRRVVSAFERSHPGVRVNFAMNAADAGPIAGADVVVLEAGGSFERAHEYREWVDDSVPGPAALIAPLADLVSHRGESTSWPILFSGMVTYVNRRLLEEAGLLDLARVRAVRGIADTCDEYFSRRDVKAGTLGWGFHNLSMPLYLLGFARSDLSKRRADVEYYMNLLAGCPPPRLVTGEDVNSTTYLIKGLEDASIILATGYFWHNLFIDRNAWVAVPPPQSPGGAALGGAMCVSVRRTASHPDEAVAFARFLAGSEAQGIIGEAGGLLPAIEAVARRHVFYDLYRRQFEGGWLRETLDSHSFKATEAHRLLGCLHDVRSGRMDSREAVERVMSYQPGREMTVIRGWSGAAAKRAAGGRKRAARRSSR